MTRETLKEIRGRRYMLSGMEGLNIGDNVAVDGSGVYRLKMESNNHKYESPIIREFARPKTPKVHTAEVGDFIDLLDRKFEEWEKNEEGEKIKCLQ